MRPRRRPEQFIECPLCKGGAEMHVCTSPATSHKPAEGQWQTCRTCAGLREIENPVVKP